MSRGTITELIDTLKRRRFVRRLPHATDGRMRVVTMTAEGAARVAAARAELRREERRLVRALTPDQQQQMLQFVAARQADLPGP